MLHLTGEQATKEEKNDRIIMMDKREDEKNGKIADSLTLEYLIFFVNSSIVDINFDIFIENDQHSIFFFSTCILF